MGRIKKVEVSTEEKIISYEVKYPHIVLKPKVALEDIGKVKTFLTSDGITDFVGKSITLVESEDVWVCLRIVEGKYYIDQPHQIKRLTKELIEKYSLGKYLKIKEE